MIIVSSADVAAVFRPLSAAEETITPGLIAQALTKLRIRVPGVDDLAEGDELRDELARMAVVNAVKRVLINPSMMRQVAQTAGTFSQSGTYDGSAATGVIEIDDADLYGLLPSTTALPGTARIRSGYPQPC